MVDVQFEDAIGRELADKARNIPYMVERPERRIVDSVRDEKGRLTGLKITDYADPADGAYSYLNVHERIVPLEELTG
jgi:hypothetical protein